jgi:hypothetical protein
VVWFDRSVWALGEYSGRTGVSSGPGPGLGKPIDPPRLIVYIIVVQQKATYQSINMQLTPPKTHQIISLINLFLLRLVRSPEVFYLT